MLSSPGTINFEKKRRIKIKEEKSMEDVEEFRSTSNVIFSGLLQLEWGE